MGLKAPAHNPTSPLQSYANTEPVPANASYPSGIDAAQHALATAGHHYGIAMGTLVTAGTYVLGLPVPPSVVYVQVTIIMQGNGTITIDSTNNGEAKTWTSVGVADDIANTFILKTSGLPGDSITSPLKVRSSAAWTWADETVTLVLSGAGTIHSIAFDPVWEAQAT